LIRALDGGRAAECHIWHKRKYGTGETMAARVKKRSGSSTNRESDKIIVRRECHCELSFLGPLFFGGSGR
jgi:hypothetical protein